MLKNKSHNNGNKFNATEMYMLNFMWCIVHHNKNKIIGRDSEYEEG